MIYEGGCAIMLKVWNDKTDFRFLNHLKPLADTGWTVHDPKDYHLTLVFVGRDLMAGAIQRVIATAFDLEGGPIDVRFTGFTDTFKTSKGRYVVALVEPDNLLARRNAAIEKLAEYGVFPSDSFPFKPHVTLAETKPKVNAPEIAELKLPATPFTVQCSQLEVKYGRHRMVVEL